MTLWAEALLNVIDTQPLVSHRVDDLLDLLEGMKTTLRELFVPKVTIRYPEERMEPADQAAAS